mgnify:CR=1 FL=1
MDVTFINYPIQEWILNEESGSLGEVEQSISAITQDIKFALSTERNMYPIMGSNFGVEFNDLIGKDKSYVRAQLRKRIVEALLIDDRINSINSFSFSYPDANSIAVSFIVETKLGNIQMSTEIIS